METHRRRQTKHAHNGRRTFTQQVLSSGSGVQKWARKGALAPLLRARQAAAVWRQGAATLTTTPPPPPRKCYWSPSPRDPNCSTGLLPGGRVLPIAAPDQGSFPKDAGAVLPYHWVRCACAARHSKKTCFL